MPIDTTVDRTIVGTKEFCKRFLCSESDIVGWRAQGMPYIKTDCIYEYRVTDCQAWFAGTYKATKHIKAPKAIKEAEAKPQKLLIAPELLQGYVSQVKASKILRINGRLMKEARLAGMPCKRVKQANIFNIAECVKWLETSEVFKHRIKWCMKGGNDDAGE